MKKNTNVEANINTNTDTNTNKTIIKKDKIIIIFICSFIISSVLFYFGVYLVNL